MWGVRAVTSGDVRTRDITLRLKANPQKEKLNLGVWKKLNLERSKMVKPKFDKKAWLKQHLRKKTACPLCGSVVVRHMLKRHQATNKCMCIALGRLNLKR